MTDKLRDAVATVLTNVSNYPKRVQPRVLGESLGPLIDRVTEAVRSVLAEQGDALDSVRALVDQWSSTPDYQPSEYDRGRVEQRHDMTMQLLEALRRAEMPNRTIGPEGDR